MIRGVATGKSKDRFLEISGISLDLLKEAFRPFKVIRAPAEAKIAQSGVLRAERAPFPTKKRMNIIGKEISRSLESSSKDLFNEKD